MPRKTLLVLSLAFNIAIVLFFIGKRIYYAYNKPTNYNYTTEHYMQAAAKLQANLVIDTGDIVFLGNSLTSNFPVTEMFGSLKYKNRGVAGNRISHILQRVKHIAEAHPSIIFLEGGINDLDEKTPAEVFKDYCKIIQVIREAPATRLIVQSTLPVSGDNLRKMPAVDSLNTLLKQYCAENKIQYLDLHPVLRKGPGLDSMLTWDGLHLNYEGYKSWLSLIKDYAR